MLNLQQSVMGPQTWDDDFVVVFGSALKFLGNRKIWRLLFHFIGSNTIEYHCGFGLLNTLVAVGFASFNT